MNTTPTSPPSQPQIQTPAQNGAHADPQHAPAGGEPFDATGCSILVVDDNEQNLELLAAYLEDLRCEVRTARDGLEALEAVKAKRADLVLMDIMMPRMSGYQATRRLKADPGTKGIPVVMVTALTEVGDVEKAVESGADDFLSKPVNRVELLTRVRTLLRVGSLQKQLDKAVAEVKRLGGGS